MFVAAAAAAPWQRVFSFAGGGDHWDPDVRRGADEVEQCTG